MPTSLVASCKYNQGPAQPERCLEAGVLIYNVEAYNVTSINAIINRHKGKWKNDLIETCCWSYCNQCLKYNYENFSYEEIKKPDWYCPFCKGICNCSRCIRQDQLTKMWAHLFSMGGSLEYLWNHKSVIDQLFGQYWANISQIVCFADDNNKPTPLMVSDHSETYSTDVDNLIEQK